MSTRRDVTLKVPLLEPPTRVFSARELREQLGAASAPAEGEREAPTRPLSRAELAREIALAEAAATDDSDEAITRWLPRSLPGVPSSAPQDVTITRFDASELRAEVPRLGAAAVRSEPSAAMPEPHPDRHLGSVQPRRRRWAALVAAAAVALLAVGWLGSQRRASPAPRSSPAAPAAAIAAIPVPKVAPSVPSPVVPHGSPRRALDLLLGGQREQALDAYRALAHERPTELVYAQLVDLLEREARACAEPGTCP